MAIKQVPVELPTRDSLVRDQVRGRLLARLFRRKSYRWSGDDTVLGILADAHNTGQIDVLKILTPETLSAYTNRDFYYGQALYAALIPKLTASAGEIVRAVSIFIATADGSGKAYFPAKGLENWCAVDPARPADLLSLIEQGFEGAEQFLRIALLAGAKVDHSHFFERAIGYAVEGTQTAQCQAIAALAHIPIETDADYNSVIATFRKVQAKAEDILNREILVSAMQCHSAAPKPHADHFEAIIQDILDDPGRLTLNRCALELSFLADELSDGIRQKCLEALLKSASDDHGIVESLDLAMSHLGPKIGWSNVARYLERFLGNRKGELKLKQFDSVCHAILVQGGPDLEDWVIAWFLKGDFELCYQMCRAFFGAGTHEMTFNIDFSRYQLGEAHFSYLARKTIGFLFLNPATATSILVSLLRAAPAEAAAEIENFLFDPMLLNYSGAAREYLQAVSDDLTDAASDPATRALEKLEAYFEGLDTLKDLNELRPSERERVIEWQRSSDSMAAAYKQADKKSILHSLFTRKTILYGNGFIQSIKSRNEPSRRLASKMGSHHVSTEIPRMSIIDPIGIDQMLSAYCQEAPPL